MTLKTTTGINEAAAAKGHRGIRRSMKESALIGEKQNTNSPFFCSLYVRSLSQRCFIYTSTCSEEKKAENKKGSMSGSRLFVAALHVKINLCIRTMYTGSA